MVLVDTSIWIDFFQAPESHTGSALESLIKDHNSVAICGIVLQEVLQGIRNGLDLAPDTMYHEIKRSTERRYILR